MSADPRADALRVLSLFFTSDSSLGDTLLKVGEIAADALPAAEAAGISMLDGEGRPTTAVHTDDVSPLVDAAQYESGRGPCLDAWRTGRVVHLPDLHLAAGRYPELCERAVELGFRSTLSLPLVAEDQGLGVLTLYARRPESFTAADEALGLDLATAASIVLANASAYWEAVELTEHLKAAIESRAVIDQAKGVLMARTAGLDPDGAFAVLVKASQRENVKLRTIAERIVEGTGADV